MRIFALFLLHLPLLACAPTVPQALIAAAHSPDRVHSLECDAHDGHGDFLLRVRAAGYDNFDGTDYLYFDFSVPLQNLPTTIGVTIRRSESGTSPYCFEEEEGMLSFDLPKGYEVSEQTEQGSLYEICLWDIDLTS
jgi:hypothetical protein